MKKALGLVLTIGLVLAPAVAARAFDYRIGGTLRPMVFYSNVLTDARPEVEIYHSDLILSGQVSEGVSFLSDFRFGVYSGTPETEPNYYVREANFTYDGFLAENLNLKVGQTRTDFTRGRFYLLTEPVVYYESDVTGGAFLAYQTDWGKFGLGAFALATNGFKNALLTYESPDLFPCANNSLIISGAYRNAVEETERDSDIDAAIHFNWGGFIFDSEYMARLTHETYGVGFVGAGYYLWPELLVNVSYEFFQNYGDVRYGINSGFSYQLRPGTSVGFEFDNFWYTDVGREIEYMLGLTVDF